MGAKSIYVALTEKLREEIISTSESGADLRLPTDRELERRYRVSRHTIGKALALLEAEGLLSREQGRGTFIRRPGPRPIAVSNSATMLGFIAPVRSPTARESEFHTVVQRIMLGVEHAARVSGFRILVSIVGIHTLDEERERFADLVRSGVGGIILHPLPRRVAERSTDYLLSEFLDIPTVLAGSCLPYQGRIQFAMDNERLGYDMMQFLLRQGHERIALVLPWPEDNMSPAFEDRILGFRRAAHESGLTLPSGWIQYDTGQGTRHSVQMCLEGIRPSAIIAFNDGYAIDIIDELEVHSISVPEQITVVGFDNLPEARRFKPPFPTSNPDHNELGVRATKSLLDAIETGERVKSRVLLPVPLYFRSLRRAGANATPVAEQHEITRGEA